MATRALVCAGMHGDYRAGWLVVMVVGMLILWAVIVLASVRLIRSGPDRSEQTPRRSGAASTD